ncbi:uncharacterized protein LOC122026143 [Zingiber officinale]|uniref:uncharacterized protein LOC122026143 n=1 Tax=Zingiber officinale TaxID=94328 RepID=UPI001C4C9586|nr:uncharacterized protein LOC122026143 [Zingiber officinale]
MKETIRCCISCILPCGALDVVRVVHADGRVDQIVGAATAADVMRAHPNHVLRMLASASSASPNAAVTLPPTADLHRGKIYFLVPAPPPPPPAKKAGGTGTRRRRRKKKEAALGGDVNGEGEKARLLLVNERYLSEIMSERAAPEGRRRGRAAVWRPHLESISEVS